ncbi:MULTISPECIES: hypothetical protein [unclassified Bartonella]|uniref:hypothetical protein n=1 Tax=unclassified Bartonella TaxID=2645622 RepID=UPI0035D05E67
MIKKKYELTDATIEVNGRTLHRIRALRDFGNVEKGDLGGFIEHEGNLSHEGDCWVGDNAWVYEGARVYDDAQISDNVQVFGNAEVYEGIHFYGYIEVYGDVRVFGNCDAIYITNDAGAYGYVDNTDLTSTREQTK